MGCNSSSPRTENAGENASRMTSVLRKKAPNTAAQVAKVNDEPFYAGYIKVRGAIREDSSLRIPAQLREVAHRVKHVMCSSDEERAHHAMVVTLSKWVKASGIEDEGFKLSLSKALAVRRILDFGVSIASSKGLKSNSHHAALVSGIHHEHIQHEMLSDENEQLISSMLATKSFACFGESALRQVVGQMTLVEFSRGEKVIVQGKLEEDAPFYIVHEGTLSAVLDEGAVLGIPAYKHASSDSELSACTSEIVKQWNRQGNDEAPARSGSVTSAQRMAAVVRSEYEDACAVDSKRTRRRMSTVAQYHRGDLFGEVGMLLHTPRACSVVAETDCSLWMLTRRKFAQSASSASKAFADSVVEAFSNVEIFRGLSDVQLRRLASRAIRRTFEDGECILVEGETGDTMYVVVSGECQVYVRRMGESGEGLLVNTLGTGSCFGERALLEGNVEGNIRGADVRTKGSVVLIALKHSCCLEMIGPVQKAVSMNAKMEALRHLPELSTVGKHELSEIANAMESEVYNEGEAIYRMGEEAKCLYVIDSGEVSLFVHGDGEHEIVSHLIHGQCFGGRDHKYQENAVAHGHTVLFAFRGHTADTKLGDVHLEDMATPQLALHAAAEHKDEGQFIQWDHLKIEDQLGEGAYGTVKLVLDHNTGRVYALKILDRAALRTQGRSRSELFITKALQPHPNIIRFVKRFRKPHDSKILLDAYMGGSLHHRIVEHYPLPIDDIKFYAAQLIFALKHLDKHHVVHRDLKPENILLDSDGYLKIVDFGLSAKLKGEGDRAYSVCGSVLYIAPEMLAHEGYNVMADWWSFGVIVHEMAFGFVPFSVDFASESKGGVDHFHEMHLIYDRIKLYIKDYADMSFFDINDEHRCSNELACFMKGLLHPDPNLRTGPDAHHPNPNKYASFHRKRNCLLHIIDRIPASYRVSSTGLSGKNCERSQCWLRSFRSFATRSTFGIQTNNTTAPDQSSEAP